MEFLYSIFNKGYKKLQSKEDIFPIIPQQVLAYFPVAKGIREEEFEYVSLKFYRLYSNSIRRNYDKNRFIVSSLGEKIDLMSTSGDVIEKVNWMKGRNEMEPFIKKYNFDPKIIEPFRCKPAHIDFLLMKYDFERFKYGLFDNLADNFYLYSLEFRSSYMDFLFGMIPRFNYHNICILCQELESFKNPDFWEAYEDFWREFGYDEHFSTWEYKRAYNYLDSNDYGSRDRKIIHFSLILLRLSKRDILSKDSYSGIDGIYYFLSVADSAIKKSCHRKWIIEGFKWYGQREEIESFCNVNRIQYPFIE